MCICSSETSARLDRMLHGNHGHYRWLSPSGHHESVPMKLPDQASLVLCGLTRECRWIDELWCAFFWPWSKPAVVLLFRTWCKLWQTTLRLGTFQANKTIKVDVWIVGGFSPLRSHCLTTLKMVSQLWVFCIAERDETRDRRKKVGHLIFKGLVHWSFNRQWYYIVRNGINFDWTSIRLHKHFSWSSLGSWRLCVLLIPFSFSVLFRWEKKLGGMSLWLSVDVTSSELLVDDIPLLYSS